MRYLIFAGQCYYAAGGARDLIDGTDDIDEAKAFAKCLIGMRGIIDEDDSCDFEWSHVLDSHARKIIFKSGDDPCGRSFGGDMVQMIKSTD